MHKCLLEERSLVIVSCYILLKNIYDIVTYTMQQYFQGHTSCDFSESTAASRYSSPDILSCTSSNMGFCLLHNPFRVYLLWCAHNHGHRSFEAYLSMGTHILLDTGVPACPIQQHTKSSKALVICQSRQLFIGMVPVRVEQITRTTAISKSKKDLGFSMQSSKQASPMANTGAFQLLAKQL